MWVNPRPAVPPLAPSVARESERGETAALSSEAVWFTCEGSWAALHLPPAQGTEDYNHRIRDQESLSLLL